MAFYEHQLHWHGATGSLADYKPEYTAVYRLLSNDGNDQAQLAHDYVLANIAGLGDSYAYGNDANSLALLSKITPTRDLGSIGVWNVSLHYAVPSDDDKKKDENGDPSDNPLDWRAEINVSTAQYTKPVEGAEYLKGFKGVAAQKWKPGTVGPVMNSAFVRFDPPPEADHSRKVIRITKNLANFDVDSLDMNVINSRKVKYNYRGLRQTIPKYQGKVRDFSVSMRSHNGADYLELEVYIDVNPETWILKIYDRGTDPRAMPGDPNGRGGVISVNDLVTGDPRQRRGQDFDQMPIMDPQFLDGDGQFLKIEGPFQAVVLHYRPFHYTPVNFAAIKPLAGIFR
jgi:hypothetical protein